MVDNGASKKIVNLQSLVRAMVDNGASKKIVNL